uniref:Uncharacterized protein n=1 Tax=Sphaerodactylus townsendi TaxID=933632 RepID=A0ACB8EYH1_9SAUR
MPQDSHEAARRDAARALWTRSHGTRLVSLGKQETSLEDFRPASEKTGWALAAQRLGQRRLRLEEGLRRSCLGPCYQTTGPSSCTGFGQVYSPSAGVLHQRQSTRGSSGNSASENHSAAEQKSADAALAVGQCLTAATDRLCAPASGEDLVPLVSFKESVPLAPAAREPVLQ